jgi:hypothetical protein
MTERFSVNDSYLLIAVEAIVTDEDEKECRKARQGARGEQ